MEGAGTEERGKEMMHLACCKAGYVITFNGLETWNKYSYQHIGKRLYLISFPLEIFAFLAKICPAVRLFLVHSDLSQSPSIICLFCSKKKKNLFFSPTDFRSMLVAACDTLDDNLSHQRLMYRAQWQEFKWVCNRAFISPEIAVWKTREIHWRY